MAISRPSKSAVLILIYSAVDNDRLDSALASDISSILFAEQSKIVLIRGREFVFSGALNYLNSLILLPSSVSCNPIMLH